MHNTHQKYKNNVLINKSIETILGLSNQTISKVNLAKAKIKFSFMFFSNIREDIDDRQKYCFMRDLTLFADKEMFDAVYLPERHFHKCGSIYANPAITAAYLISQTKRIRFRTAGISLPLHHPVKIVEWWAMNDVLSNGRIDLGFGCGWKKEDFIFSPCNYKDRRQICANMIPIIKRLWKGEKVSFSGPNEETVSISVFPRPVQSELNIWLLVTQSDEGFYNAGYQGYNVFTMLYGNNLKIMQKKISLYRKGRQQAGLDINKGTVTLMLHTFIFNNTDQVSKIVEKPFKAYIKNLMNSHLKVTVEKHNILLSKEEKEKILNYSYQRYFKTSALFGSVDDGKKIVDYAISIGVNEIACVVDFGVDDVLVMESLSYLKLLVSTYS